MRLANLILDGPLLNEDSFPCRRSRFIEGMAIILPFGRANVVVLPLTFLCAEL